MGNTRTHLRLPTLIPSIVQGIESIHGNAVAGADKKTTGVTVTRFSHSSG